VKKKQNLKHHNALAKIAHAKKMANALAQKVNASVKAVLAKKNAKRNAIKKHAKMVANAKRNAIKKHAKMVANAKRNATKISLRKNLKKPARSLPTNSFSLV